MIYTQAIDKVSGTLISLSCRSSRSTYSTQVGISVDQITFPPQQLQDSYWYWLCFQQTYRTDILSLSNSASPSSPNQQVQMQEMPTLYEYIPKNLPIHRLWPVS